MADKLRRMTETVGKRINETLHVRHVFIENNMSKEDFLKEFQFALDEADKLNAQKFDFYFVGHGHSAYGGWVMNSHGDINNLNQNTVKIKDVLTIINNKNMMIGFEITSESCYSGEICHQAKKWCEENPSYHFKYLIVNASTFRLNKGVWGKYRRFKRATIVGVDKGVTKEEAAKAQEQYGGTFGLTTFDSRKTHEIEYENARDKNNIFPYPIWTQYPHLGSDAFSTDDNKTIDNKPNPHYNPKIREEFNSCFWKDTSENVLDKCYKHF